MAYIPDFDLDPSADPITQLEQQSGRRMLQTILALKDLVNATTTLTQPGVLVGLLATSVSLLRRLGMGIDEIVSTAVALDAALGTVEPDAYIALAKGVIGRLYALEAILDNEEGNTP